MNVISLKNITVILLIVSLLLSSVCISSEKASAAEKRKFVLVNFEGTGYSEEHGKAFTIDWAQSEDETESTSGDRLYVFNMDTGKGKKKLHECKPGEHFGSQLLTDGSVVYYTVYNDNKKSTQLYSVGIDGKNKTKLKTFSSNRVFLASVYNKQIYYTKADPDNYLSSNLYSLSLKTGKIYKRQDGFTLSIGGHDYDGYSTGRSRYIYGRHVEYYNWHYEIYDCKTKTVVHKFDNSVCEPYVLGNYLYYTERDYPYGESRDHLYRSSLNGDNKELLGVVETSYKLLGYFSTSVIYYYEMYKANYFKYYVKTGKTVKITPEQFKSKPFYNVPGNDLYIKN